MRWGQKSCKKGEESFHGLKRESATMEVGESIGCTCQLPSDGSASFHPMHCCVSMV